MTLFDKHAVRAAGRIYDAYRLMNRRQPLTLIDDALWQEHETFRRRMSLAVSRGFHAATRRLRLQLNGCLRELRQRIDVVISETTAVPCFAPSMCDLLEEIRALQDEYGIVQFDFAEQVLSVTTDPITLDEVALGPFEIRLRWDCLHEPRPYVISAQEPLFAASQEDVCHPHVEAGRLCEGDGHAAIRQALKDGRLGDFFAIVAQILNTYNSSSAYVTLDQWDGIHCADCGTFLPAENTYVCESCRCTICSDCDVHCNTCGDVACAECSHSCAGCEFGFCSLCLKTCPGCSAPFCADCLIEERCRHCHEQMQEEQDEAENCYEETATRLATTAASPDAAVQSNGVVQAGLFAGLR